MATHELNELQERLRNLERENRLWRWGVVGVLLGMAMIVTANAWQPRSLEAAQEEPAQERRVEEPRDPEVIYQQLHEMGHRAVDLVDASIRMGAVPQHGADVVALWSMRLLGTDIYNIPMHDGRRTLDPELHMLFANQVQEEPRVEAFREHLARLTEWENRFRPLARNGSLSELEFLEFQARRVLAEAWLARELNKPVSP